MKKLFCIQKPQGIARHPPSSTKQLVFSDQNWRSQKKTNKLVEILR